LQSLFCHTDNHCPLGKAPLLTKTWAIVSVAHWAVTKSQCAAPSLSAMVLTKMEPQAARA
jgi:hypothetical protein